MAQSHLASMNRLRRRLLRHARFLGNRSTPQSVMRARRDSALAFSALEREVGSVTESGILRALCAEHGSPTAESARTLLASMETTARALRLQFIRHT